MLPRPADRVDFGELFQSLPLPAVVVRAQHPEYPIVAANNAYCNAANAASNGAPISPEALTETSLFAINLPGGVPLELIQRSLQAAMASGKTDSVSRQADGQTWAFTHSPMPGADNSVQYITQYIQSKQASAELASAELASAELASSQLASSQQASAKIAATEQHLVQTFESANTGFVLFNTSGRILNCNAAFATSVGHTREDLPGTDAASIVHPADREQRNHLMWKLFNGELPAFTLESRYLRQDGSDLWTCDSVTLLRDEAGSPQRIVVISEDISKRKRAEKMLAQTEGLVTMGRLSASIAHELNNPLESVTNLLFLISNGTQIEDMHYYSHLAEQELARVTKIATQTLRFYRPQSAPAPVDLTDVVDSVLALFEGRIRREHVSVIKRYRPATPSLLTYNSELRQVFLNLIGNSLDAMAADGVLQISVRPSRNWIGNHARGVRVTICDAGSGIPKSMLQKVFEPFVSTKEQTGTGLGLWISRDIIRRHGGVLHVRSAETGPRHGTCMSVFLPEATEQADANAA